MCEMNDRSSETKIGTEPRHLSIRSGSYCQKSEATSTVRTIVIGTSTKRTFYVNKGENPAEGTSIQSHRGNNRTIARSLRGAYYHRIISNYLCLSHMMTQFLI